MLRWGKDLWGLAPILRKILETAALLMPRTHQNAAKFLSADAQDGVSHLLEDKNSPPGQVAPTTTGWNAWLAGP